MRVYSDSVGGGMRLTINGKAIPEKVWAEANSPNCVRIKDYVESLQKSSEADTSEDSTASSDLNSLPDLEVLIEPGIGAEAEKAENSTAHTITKPQILQSVEVIGEDTAVWKIKFPRTDLAAALKEIGSPVSTVASSNSVLSSADRSQTQHQTSSEPSSSDTSSNNSSTGFMGSILSNFTTKATNSSRAFSTTPDTEPSFPPTTLVSAPFRLRHVLLGDFWLELIANPDGTALLFFKCGYPDLGVRVQLEVSENFTKTFVAKGRASVGEDMKAEAYLRVNKFMDSGNTGGESQETDSDFSELTIKAELLELVKIPKKLRGVVS